MTLSGFLTILGTLALLGVDPAVLSAQVNTYSWHSPGTPAFAPRSCTRSTPATAKQSPLTAKLHAARTRNRLAGRG